MSDGPRGLKFNEVWSCGGSSCDSLSGCFWGEGGRPNFDRRRQEWLEEGWKIGGSQKKNGSQSTAPQFFFSNVFHG